MDRIRQHRLLSPFENGKTMKFDETDEFFGSEFIKFLSGPMGEPLPHLRLPLPDAWRYKEYILSKQEIEQFVADFNRAVVAYRAGHFDVPIPGGYYVMSWQPGVLSDEVIMDLMALTRSVTVKRDRELEGVSTGTGKYGEITSEQMLSIVKELDLGLEDVFVDLGSGIGHLLACVALSSSVKKSVGVEFIETRAKRALEYHETLKRILQFFGRAESMGEVELHEGSFLEPQHKEFVKTQATVVFANNLVFGPDTTNQLKELFAECQKGIRIVSTSPFVTENDQKRKARQLRDALPEKVTLSQLKTTQRNNGWSSTSCPIFMMTKTID